MSISSLPRCLDLDSLDQWRAKPALFAPGTAPLWTDPHIAHQMLAAHLDPDSDVASRRAETIERSVSWLVQSLGLRAGDSVLDLGCGPGLYASRLAKLGLQVTGVDFSQGSIDHATRFARQHGLQITYRVQDYLELADEACYDLALLIYGDFCPLAPEQRTRLLANARRALRPGGRLVLDVSTPVLRQRIALGNRWHVEPSGFWRPGPHLVLEQGFAYPEHAIYLDQYVVLEADGTMCLYRNWFQDFTADSLRAELEANGWTVESLWSDLTGTPYTPAAEWIGVVARRG